MSKVQKSETNEINSSLSISNSSSSRNPNSREKIYRNRFKSNQKRLSCIFENKIKKSLIGIMLHISGNLSTRDRDDMWELLKLDRVESPRRDDDLLCTDMIDSIEQALISSPVLTRSTVFNQITNLRLMDCGIEEMDDSLTGLNNLKLLNLSGNWIKYITGAQLPRNLGILEMFSNELSSVRSLCENLPETLLHIGLGRNNISDDSELYLLSKMKFSMLRSLDLSDNDIEDLIQVLENLNGVPRLLALQLQGNPCSMCYLYRQAASAKLPRLKFLDYYAISSQEEDEEFYDEYDLEEGIEGGALCFYCYRIMGIPQPDKNDVYEKQKVVHKYYVEVEAPLLQENLQEDEESSTISSHETETGVELELEHNRDPEFETEPELPFKSPSISWKPILEFPAPCIRIKAYESYGLKNLRDTFRSNVKVRLIYVRSVPPEKPKRNEPTPIAPAEDIILSKTILAEFNVPLETITWAHASLDYSWEKISEDFNENAKLLPGCAKDLNYKEPGSKKPTKDKSPGSISLPIPEILTFHIGFGLQKTLPDPENDAIIIVDEAPKKK